MTVDLYPILIIPGVSSNIMPYRQNCVVTKINSFYSAEQKSIIKLGLQTVKIYFSQR
jgi:hypothetical protein